MKRLMCAVGMWLWPILPRRMKAWLFINASASESEIDALRQERDKWAGKGHQ